MRTALATYLHARARGADHRAAVRVGAESVAGDPWRVVGVGGALARGVPDVARADLGLTAGLAEVAVDSPRAIATVAAGQPYVRADTDRRRRRGAYDTPRDLARRVARATVSSACRAARGLDPACGAGAFLVAMHELGVPELIGADLDPVVVDVARVACPSAHVTVADALQPGPSADVVCGNPPFVRSERQDRGLRAELRRRLPWLRGRFDLVVPFAALVADRVTDEGALGLVLPFAMLVQPYASTLRRRWLQSHEVLHLEGPEPFGGAAVSVGWAVLRRGSGEGAWPARSALRLPDVPLSPDLAPGDVEIVEQMAARSETLGALCEIDTGLVAHGRGGPKARLIAPGPDRGTVPYADARDFFGGGRRFLRYRPAEMHRPKRPGLFEPDKIVIQRLRGSAPVRAAVDRQGIYVGHTCTVALPWGPGLDLDALVDLIRSPLVDGFTRIRCGARLDLYPRDVRAIPVPRRWLVDPRVDLAAAFGLDDRAVERLGQLAGA